MSESPLIPRIQAASATLRERLLVERNPAGHWRGELASSALSTATAVMALHSADAEKHRELVRRGLQWLADTQCADGGWGDTTLNLPNLSTTAICWSAFGIAAGEESLHADTVARCEAWLRNRAGDISPAALSEALARRYGKDRTFSVPILMACALGGRLGPAPDCWQHVPQLPFELAALPRKWFAALRLPVVSYALPALIAIGQVRFHHRRGNPALALLRRSAIRRTRSLLREIQPPGGGYLEATPLTSFVTMALCGMQAQDDPVVQEAVTFLINSVRPDGSWPIDTDLATWGTTLAVRAMEEVPEPDKVRQWLCGQQYREVHPYTLSAPGGWAWTDLPGGVPDADDTSSSLLALPHLGEPADSPAAAAGVRWLLALQNGNGGIPTFCRGWGALPFDRSTPEITAHTLAAWHQWRHLAPAEIAAATKRALKWIASVQHVDGWWEPLWFGNEHMENEINPVYGTATVLRYLAPLSEQDFPALTSMRARALSWLLSAQLPDGSWGGGRRAMLHFAPTGEPLQRQETDMPASIEETSVALSALCTFPHSPALTDPVTRAAAALLRLTNDGQHTPPAPIGLYFAKLWYHERLYPAIFSLGALRAAEKWLAQPTQ